MTEVTTALVNIKPEADKAVIALYEQSLKLEQYALALVITDMDNIKSATNDLSIISGLKKAIEEKRKEYTQPINEHLKAVNEAFKSFTEPLNRTDQITRHKILDYRNEQERIRQEQERINKLKAEAALAELALKGEVEELPEPIEVTPEQPTRYRAEMGTTSMMDVWKYEVTDFALLPDEYKVVDSSMLTAVARKHHDQKQVAGVRFYNEPTLRVIK